MPERNFGPARLGRSDRETDFHQARFEAIQAFLIESRVPPQEIAILPSVSRHRLSPRRLLIIGGPLAVAALTLAPSCGGNGGGEETATPTATPKVEKPLDPRHFLSWPYPDDPQMKLVQGWIYEGREVPDGTEHRAIDFVEGTDPNQSSTWKNFPILTAAGGFACQSSFESKTYGRDYTVRVIHPNGYETRYLHLKSGSIPNDMPDCSVDKKDWESVERGEQIGEAGDSGTNPGWDHLHLEVRDQSGEPVDPYDIYGRKGLYPDPNFTNGKTCGSEYLWTYCPTGEVLGEATTATPEPSIRETPTPPSTAERLQSGEGIVNLGNWQLAIQSWEEAPYKEIISGVTGNPEQLTREGWKYVTISGRLRNISQSIVNNGGPAFGQELFNFGIEEDGFFYGSESAEFNPLDFQVPPGFSHPIKINAWVPEIKTGYSLVVSTAVNYQPGQRLASLRKGEVAVDYSNILPEVQIKNPDESWELPGFAMVYFNGIFTAPAVTIVDGEYKEEFASFDIQNNYGRDIKTGYGLGGLNFLIFLPDGRVIEGSPYYYSEKVHDTDLVPPGFRLTVDINFAGGDSLVDVDGAIAVLFFNNQWSAWRIDAEAVEFPSIGQEKQQDEYGRQLITSYINETLKSKFIPEGIPEIVAQESRSDLEDQKIIGGEWKVRSPGYGEAETDPIVGQPSGSGQYQLTGLYFRSIKGTRFQEDGLPLDVDLMVRMTGRLNEMITRENAAAKIAYYFNLPQLPLEAWRETDISGGGKIFEVSWQNPDGSVETRSIRLEKNTLDEYIDIRIVACRLFEDNPVYQRASCWG